MYLLTVGHCGCEDKEFRCCSKEYCIAAAGFALLYHNIRLTSTKHPIPFMGTKGCIVSPHLRPICTLHVCNISWKSGEFPSDPERTRRYRELRGEIESEARRRDLWPLA